jgi:uncharacterized protein (TIGR02301 family)
MRRPTALAVLLASLSLTPATLAGGVGEARPYDEKLLRLSEILGSVHYLRELCGANEGQFWREQMRSLVDAEASSAARRARFSRAFNQGYRTYSRTYTTCSPSAQSAMARFLTEGTEISETLIKATP